jgi:colicin import membrane protein
MTQDLILKAELKATDEMQVALRAGSGVVAVAEACVIDSPEMADLANDEMRSCKAAAKKLDEMRKAFIEPAKQIIATADGMFKPALEALVQAEGVYKTKLLGWTREQERIAEEARRQAAEAERKARAEAEAKAAALRAKAEQEAAEKRRQAQEAEQARLKAEAEGNARAAAAAAAQAARLQQEAQSKTDEAEAKATDVALTVAASAPAPIPVATAPKGFGSRENWVAELAPGHTEHGALQKICEAIADGRLDLFAVVKLDMSAANKLAKAQKKHMSVPGLVAVDRPVATSRAA